MAPKTAHLISLVLFATLLLLGGCGLSSAFGKAAADSRMLEERSTVLEKRAAELDEKLRMLDEAIRTYGPLAEDLGPGIKEKYDVLVQKMDAVRGYVDQGRELLSDATELHRQSLEKATDPETGETDWVRYAIMMLAGGGGLYSERRRTQKDAEKDRSRLHSRIDKRKEEVEELQAGVEEIRRMVEGQGVKSFQSS